ncbi:hypothetical protein [Geminicoccus harenae]|uniref:hypothetical protein n=1 Tax=Geminicoccus harenae TaxID=2498453 RepID=UPI00168BA506|nr:hypothetical protein [Geminicoccus harenae]
MGTSARVFVDYWIEQNVEAEIYSDTRHRSREYAAQCLQAAKDRGISVTEIWNECGDLATYIAGTSDRAIDQQPFSWSQFYRG